MQNAKSDASSWSLNCIRDLLSTRIVIFLDELDKIKTVGTVGASSDNWYRGCQTEIMQLLDRTMGEVSLTPTQRENLRHSWIICAGAFQDIYKRKIGGDVLLAEQLDVEVNRSDLEDGSGLPTELLNRVGEIVSIPSPSPEEVAEAFSEISKIVGFSPSEKERMAMAHEIVVSLQGFRGLEQYVIQCARRALSQK